METLRLQTGWSIAAALLGAVLVGCDGPAGPGAGTGASPAKDAETLAAALPRAPEGTPRPPEPGISLQVAVVLGAPGTTLAFSLENRGARPFETTPIATNYNRLLVTLPGGERVEHFAWKDGIRPAVVAPSGKASWKIDLEPVFDLRGWKAPGLYRLRWRVGEAQSEEVLLLKE